MLILIPSQDHVTKRNEGLWGRECQFLCIPHHRLKKRFFGGRCERLSEINEGQIFAPCEAISFILVTSTPQSLFEPPSKGKGANEPKAHTAGAYNNGFRSTKHA